MKKSLALTAALVLCASQAWAYENLHAGYSVQDKNPFYKMASKDIYAYSSFGADNLSKLEKIQRGSVHIVAYYTAEEMEKIIGEKFTTAYFDKQYEQMAVLQRSELNMLTVPNPLLDMERYAEQDNDNTIITQYYKEQFKTLEPKISLGIVNGQRTIKLSYLYKQMKSLIAVDQTLLSANDRLYMLTTVTVDDKIYADDAKTTADKEQKETTADDVVSKEKLNEAIKQATKIEKVNPADIDAKIIKAMDKTHERFIKGFKAFAPQGSAKPIVLKDDVAKKTITLPQDWFYTQIQIKEKEAEGSITTAASLPAMKKIAQELDYMGIYGLFADDFIMKRHNTHIEAAEPDDGSDSHASTEGEAKINYELSEAAEAKILAETRKALKNFDAMLFTCSFKLNDKDFQEMLALPRTQQLETEMFLSETLQRLKNHHNQDAYLSLDDYSYDIGFTKEKVLIDINTKISVLKDFKFTNLMRFASLSNNCGGMMLYTHKSDLPADEQIMKGIDEWQF